MNARVNARQQCFCSVSLLSAILTAFFSIPVTDLWAHTLVGIDNARPVPWPNTGFKAASVGYMHHLGLKDDGSIVAWGPDNGFGQCDVPLPNTGYVGVSAGYYHSLGLKSDGSIVAWGDNRYGQCNVPEPNGDFAAIAAGYQHSLGLKEDGTVVEWGAVIVPLPWLNRDFSSIAAGYQASYAVQADSIVKWGIASGVRSPNSGFKAVVSNPTRPFEFAGLKHDGSIVVEYSYYSGLYSVPSPNNDFVAVAIEDNYCAGLKSDGSIVAWSGQGPIDVSSPPNCCFAGLAGRFGLRDASPELTEVSDTLSPAMGLSAPVPNPFNPRTTLRLDLPVAGRVHLEVYDVAGRLIRTLLDADLPAGSHQAVWDGKDAAGRGMPSGSYFARLHAYNELRTTRLTLAK